MSAMVRWGTRGEGRPTDVGTLLNRDHLTVGFVENIIDFFEIVDVRDHLIAGDNILRANMLGLDLNPSVRWIELRRKLRCVHPLLPRTPPTLPPNMAGEGYPHLEDNHFCGVVQSWICTAGELRSGGGGGGWAFFCLGGTNERGKNSQKPSRQVERKIKVFSALGRLRRARDLAI